MTEACSSMSFIPIDEQDSTGQLGGVCVGKPAPHVELRIGQPVLDQKQVDTTEVSVVRSELFREGHVLTRGPHVMEYYWGLPTETAAVLSADGWLDTGDVGWMDEAGRLWLLGRSKDVIKSGSENVFASEVIIIFVFLASVRNVTQFHLHVRNCRDDKIAGLLPYGAIGMNYYVIVPTQRPASFRFIVFGSFN